VPSESQLFSSSLFSGNLRQCIKADGEVADFLAALGLGSDFGRYCGELDRKLTEAVRLVQADSTTPSTIHSLKKYIEKLAETGELKDKSLARARVAILTEIASRRAEIVPVISEKLTTDIEGRLARVAEVLRTKNVFLLPGGALEHYLPLYGGNRYTLDDAAKRKAVEAEVALLSQGQEDSELPKRYGGLLEVIARLPAKSPVDTDAVLLRYLGDYVHQFQGLVLSTPDWGLDQLKAQLSVSSAGLGKLFEIEKFERSGERQFQARIRIREPNQRFVDISHDTNAGMRIFELKVEENS
jgi:hypothetical protein